MTPIYEEAAAHLQTIGDFIRFAVTRLHAGEVFFGHGLHNAREEAEFLLRHVLHLPEQGVWKFRNSRLLPSEMSALLALLEARIEKRIPAAYLTKRMRIHGRDFYVDERVLIPRSFIAELLPEALSRWFERPEEVTSALDLCTGSGYLAVLLADVYPKARIDAADISDAALAVAKLNIDACKLTERIRLAQGDLFAAVDGATYDLIVSNPPYVKRESMEALPREYLAEPSLALAGGEDGLEVVRAILRGAARHLTPRGALLMEIGQNRAAYEAAFPTLKAKWLDTSAGSDNVILLKRTQLDGLNQ